MKKNVLFMATLMVVVGVFFCGNIASAKTLSKEALLERAANLMAAEAKFLQVKKKSEWEKIYAFQTAAYREKISIEEFIYTKGRKRSDWKERIEDYQSINLSGTKFKRPSVEEMRAKIEKEKPKYKVAGGKPSKITFGEQIQISPDGKYGRIITTIDILYVFVHIWIQPFISRAFGTLKMTSGMPS